MKAKIKDPGRIPQPSIEPTASSIEPVYCTIIISHFFDWFISTCWKYCFKVYVQCILSSAAHSSCILRATSLSKLDLLDNLSYRGVCGIYWCRKKVIMRLSGLKWSWVLWHLRLPYSKYSLYSSNIFHKS